MGKKTMIQGPDEMGLYRATTYQIHEVDMGVKVELGIEGFGMTADEALGASKKGHVDLELSRKERDL